MSELFFNVLLTVHLSIFISVINQLDAQNFCFTRSLFHASKRFEHMCSSSGGQNCITQPLVSSHLEVWWYQRLCNVINQLDAQNFCFTLSLFHASTSFRAHVLIIKRSKLHYTASGIITPTCAVRCTGWKRTLVLSQPVHRTATYRCDDTGGCVMQFWPLVDEHMCSKHVEAWNKLTVKQKCFASSRLISEIECRSCFNVNFNIVF